MFELRVGGDLSIFKVVCEIWIQQFYSHEGIKLRVISLCMRHFRICSGSKIFFSWRSITEIKIVITAVLIRLFTSLPSIWSCDFLRPHNLWWTQNLNTQVHSSFLTQITEIWQFTCLPGRASDIHKQTTWLLEFTLQKNTKFGFVRLWWDVMVSFTELWGIQRGTSCQNLEC